MAMKRQKGYDDAVTAATKRAKVELKTVKSMIDFYSAASSTLKMSCASEEQRRLLNKIEEEAVKLQYNLILLGSNRQRSYGTDSVNFSMYESLRVSHVPLPFELSNNGSHDTYTVDIVWSTDEDINSKCTQSIAWQQQLRELKQSQTCTTFKVVGGHGYGTDWFNYYQTHKKMPPGTVWTALTSETQVRYAMAEHLAAVFCEIEKGGYECAVDCIRIKGPMKIPSDLVIYDLPDVNTPHHYIDKLMVEMTRRTMLVYISEVHDNLEQLAPLIQKLYTSAPTIVLAFCSLYSIETRNPFAMRDALYSLIMKSTENTVDTGSAVMDYVQQSVTVNGPLYRCSSPYSEQELFENMKSVTSVKIFEKWNRALHDCVTGSTHYDLQSQLATLHSIAGRAYTISIGEFVPSININTHLQQCRTEIGVSDGEENVVAVSEKQTAASLNLNVLKVSRFNVSSSCVMRLDVDESCVTLTLSETALRSIKTKYTDLLEKRTRMCNSSFSSPVGPRPKAADLYLSPVFVQTRLGKDDARNDVTTETERSVAHIIFYLIAHTDKCEDDIRRDILQGDRGENEMAFVVVLPKTTDSISTEWICFLMTDWLGTLTETLGQVKLDAIFLPDDWKSWSRSYIHSPQKYTTTPMYALYAMQVGMMELTCQRLSSNYLNSNRKDLHHFMKLWEDTVEQSTIVQNKKRAYISSIQGIKHLITTKNSWVLSDVERLHKLLKIYECLRKKLGGIVADIRALTNIIGTRIVDDVHADYTSNIMDSSNFLETWKRKPYPLLLSHAYVYKVLHATQTTASKIIIPKLNMLEMIR